MPAPLTLTADDPQITQMNAELDRPSSADICVICGLVFSCALAIPSSSRASTPLTVVSCWSARY
jgi:hypothetical protein